MKPAKQSHRAAIEKVFTARIALDHGRHPEAGALFRQALELELTAIGQLPADAGPMDWAVLRRSAGWIAMECGQPQLARQLAQDALADNPPPEIARELRQLLRHAKANSPRSDWSS